MVVEPAVRVKRKGSAADPVVDPVVGAERKEVPTEGGYIGCSQ